MAKSKNPEKKSKTEDKAEAKGAQTSQASKDYAPKRYSRKQKHYPMSGLYWVFFIGAVILWAVVFSSRFSEFDSLTNQAEDQLTYLREVSSEAVLGIEDDEGTVGIEEVSQTPEEEVSPEVSPESTADSESVIEEIEEERKEALREALLLQLPYEIDNPNYAVTFVEPTEEGVEIQVDGDGFSQKKSPFSLPSLAIGKHTVNFRFVDEDEVKQNLEETVIVIPRAPVWDEDQKTEFRSDEKVTLLGTALPRSTVVMVVGTQLVTESVVADEEGAWRITVSEDIGTGEHVAGGYARKEGFASNFSDPLAFTVGYVEGVTSEVDEVDGSASSSSSSPWWDNYMNEDNYYIVIAGAGVAVILLILFISLVVKFLRGGRKEDAGWVEDLKNGNGEKQDDPEKVSLRDKFAQAGLDVKNIGKKSDKEDAEDMIEDATEKEDSTEDKEEVDDKKKEGDPEKEDKETTEKKVDKEEPKEEKKPEKEKVEPEPKKEEKKTAKKKEVPAEEGSKEEISKKVYSKDEFMKKYGEGEGTMGKETKKIKISLTSPSR